MIEMTGTEILSTYDSMVLALSAIKFSLLSFDTEDFETLNYIFGERF